MARRRWKSSTVGVRELRQNLSGYLARVKKGEALTVTERGTAVAILRPVPRTSSALERLVAEGLATPPTRSIRDARRALLEGNLDRPLQEVLDDLRQERL